MIEFFAFIFAGAFGFGLAFWIAATVLNNSNNYGDYHADASYYSASVHFTSDEKLKNSNSRGSYVGMGVFKKPTAPLAPKGKELIRFFFNFCLLCCHIHTVCSRQKENHGFYAAFIRAVLYTFPESVYELH